MSFVHIKYIFLFIRHSIGCLCLLHAAASASHTPHTWLGMIALFHVHRRAEEQQKKKILIHLVALRQNEFVLVQKNVTCIKCKIQIEYHFKANDCSIIWMPVKVTSWAAFNLSTLVAHAAHLSISHRFRTKKNASDTFGRHGRSGSTYAVATSDNKLTLRISCKYFEWSACRTQAISRAMKETQIVPPS